MTQFRLLRVFNEGDLKRYAGSQTRIGRNSLPHFASDSLADRLIRELAHERALPIKEVVEAFEFFAVVRKYLRRSSAVVDLCSGHGLAGLLFAIYERRVERVQLADRRKPKYHEHVWRACMKIAPWIEDKVEYVEGDIRDAQASFEPESAVLGVHACGTLTDRCVEIALEIGGPLAVMPCCRAQSVNQAPEGLRAALGEDVAYDVDRTYAMERAGYRVRWRTIPSEITPMNRVLIALPRTNEVAAASGAAN